MFKFDLHPGEKLIEMIRQTEMVLIKPCLLILIGIYVPWFFIFKYELLGQFSRLLIFWTILLLGYGIYKYLLWLLNVNLVTSQRVVRVTYRSLFNKEVSETSLERIVNISFTTKGVLPSLLGYGTVEIHMANMPDILRLSRVRQPAKIKDLLWHLRTTHGVATPRVIRTSRIV